ncbi:hypothetical protein HPB50_011379 [Hyalomma asiaticum]|uniref:Uncharacterized protein n=1 Tax=Hyalomma asiaticum TaxID=266040 RepID=A0ACB7T9A5_HYAAI|nr:hypothetical protein HPB50_011379 [Hyalomma asiaticum]
MSSPYDIQVGLKEVHRIASDTASTTAHILCTFNFDFEIALSSQLQVVRFASVNPATTDRRERLDETRNNRRVYPDPPHSMTRREAALVRRAQTHSLTTPHIEHYVQGKDGTPSCVACGGFPDNAHVLWNCPGARAAIGESLKHMPIRPATLEEWLADSSQTS